MPRDHANVKCSIWSEPEWRSLTAGAQRLYLLLLSQGRLSLAGSFDVMLSRWASLAGDTDQADIAEAFGELEKARYVVGDAGTDEAVIRTFTKHDLAPSRLSSATIKGFWTAWGSILSVPLREVVVANIGTVMWERMANGAPESAQQMRRSLPLERVPPSPPEPNGQYPPEREAAYPPEPPSPSPSPSPDPPPRQANLNSDATVAMAKRACLRIAERDISDRIDSGEVISAPSILARKRAGEDLWPVLGGTLAALVVDHPDASVDQLAELHRVGPDPLAYVRQQDADWRARAAEEPSRDEAKAIAPDFLKQAREAVG